ncbi:hypothetical protein [Tardiphaga sp. 841_E9_N1_2]|jgi:hypothetical protein|uniref:hypothetical protein n=1 Tax=Tardiphaga sp. 841_E9_N1_2 TaxID=3240762 RepID=UPI003F20EC09
MTDLWGELPTAADVKSPHAILLEQANALQDKTEGLLVGRVTRDTVNSEFMSRLAIVAPSLNNYSYSVATVVYPVNFYPLRAVSNTTGDWADLPDEKSYIAWLQAELTSAHMRKVIAGLRAEIQADYV